MRLLAYSLLVAVSTLTAGCAARQVEVGDGPAAAQSVVAISVSNTLGQAVNVYVVQGSSETFVRQLPANSTQLVSIPNVSSGQTVTLRARTVDGTRTFTSDEMTLTSGRQWSVP